MNNNLYLLKRKLKKIYLAYCTEIASFGCGIALAHHIKPSLKDQADKIETLYQKCQQLEGK